MKMISPRIPCGVGIIGASPGKSGAAIAHVPAISALNDDFTLTALATSRRASAEEAGRHFGVSRSFDNSADLLLCSEVDLVVVAVRVDQHRRLVSAAIEAGKSILCEWPLANGLVEAEMLAALARDSGVPAFVSLQSRSAPAVTFIRDLVRDGYIGEVLSTSFLGSGKFWGPYIEPEHMDIQDDALGVTMATVTTGHWLDMICHTLGEFDWLLAVVECQMGTVTARRTGERIAKTAPDQICVQGRLTSGAMINYHERANGLATTNPLWKINGTEGDIHINDPSGSFTAPCVWGRRGDRAFLAPLHIPENYLVLREADVPRAALHMAHAYARIAHDLRDGSSEAPRFEDAVLRYRMLDAIDRAVSGGRHRYN